MHYITLTVSTEDSEEADIIFEAVSATALQLAGLGMNVSVSSHREEEERFDDKTMGKVRKILFERGLTGSDPDDAINAMQNAGILFRERV